MNALQHAGYVRLHQLPPANMNHNPIRKLKQTTPVIYLELIPLVRFSID
jgi:hypothetical protein